MARAITLAVPIAAVAGPLAGTAEAKPTRTPAPQVTLKPANPTNDRTGSFAWQVAASTTYSCGLDGQQRVSCAGAFHAPSALADGLHTLVIRSQTQGMRFSNWSYSWMVDTKPPAAPSITAPPTPTSATAVSVTFSDSDTSVARYTCAVDGQTASGCSSPFSQTGFAEGSHTLQVTAYDAAGNSASSNTQWIVDRTAPDVPVVVAPASPTNATSASIAFTDADASGFTCSVDGGPDSTCLSPLQVTGLTDGTHGVTVTGHDAAGNTASATVHWLVDTVAPARPDIVTAPASLTDDTSPTVQFSDFDPSGVHFTCTVTDTTNGSVVQGPEACTTPYVVTGATTDLDSYALHLVPTDGAGNVGPADDSVAWTLDVNLTPSPASFTSAPESPSNLTTPAFGFIAPDAGQTGGATGFLCSLDNAAFTACGTPDVSAPTVYQVGTALSDGAHTFAVETTNGASTAAPVVWHWTVDTTPPAAPTVTAPDPSTPNPTITFGSTDTNVSYLCSVDGGPFVACSSPWTPPAGLAGGTHSLVVATADAAGNRTEAPAVTFTVQQSPATQPGGGSIDTTPPTVTGVIAPASLTSPVSVTFSEAVTGLVAGSARLVVTGGTSVVPTAVTCLAGGVAAGCSSSFDAIRLTPSAPLVPGQHYTVALAAGAVRDLAGNALAATGQDFRAARVVEEGNAVVRAAWALSKSRSAIGGSFVREHLAGAAATWRFTGRSVTWWTVTGPTQGKANVYVDGVRKATVNNYAPKQAFRIGRTVKGLSNKAHTLRIVVLGTKGAAAATGTFVSIDAFTVGRTRTATPALAMTLRALSSSRFYAGHAVVTDTRGAGVTLSFRGTGISWSTMRSANQGKVALYVDGALKATYDDYAAKASYHVQRTLTGLADRVHTLKLVALGTHHKGATGSLVTVDRFTVA